MLKALSVENIAVAKQLNIEFSDGFTVLTGKTGAGKSVIIDSIAMILGSKSRREAVRYGETDGSVTAIFDGEPNSGVFDENGEALLQRSVTADGKNSAKINGKSVTQSTLRELSASLLTLHGQNETTALYDKNEPVRILDEYAGCAHETEEYEKVYSRLTAKRAEIEELKRSLDDKAMMTDILKYQILEIEKAKLSDPCEEEKLEKLRLKLKSLETVTKNARFVHRALAPTEKGASAAYLLERAASALRQLSDVMEEAEDLAARLEEYRIEIIDIAERARDVVDGDDVRDPEKQLDIIETRLALLSKLKRKYGGDLEAVMSFLRDAKKKLSDLNSGENRIEELEHEYKTIAAEALKKAKIISEKRRAAGEKLSLEVMETLKFLDMPKVRFFVEVRSAGTGAEKFNSMGIDEVSFSVVTNPGEEPQPLARIASGGEMSRIMLALKCAQAKKSGAGTVVFDEIDSGVSGGTAERIGIKLAELSRSSQVICVTHSAQVAAHADHHILIEKNEIDGRAQSTARELSGAERTEEIARIIGGINVTEKQYNAAVDLLKNNKNI
ncbi:MAG: DNA repair protein RecN [Clostridia bacterium]|nr:DNA repair protein RecN [Clostridia bacterium]